MGKGQSYMLSMISQLVHLFYCFYTPLTKCALQARRPCSPQAASGVWRYVLQYKPQSKVPEVLRGCLAAGDGRGRGPGTSSEVEALRVMGAFAFLSPLQTQTLAPLLTWYSGLSDCKHPEKK